MKSETEIEWKIIRDITDYDANAWLRKYCRDAMLHPSEKGVNVSAGASARYKQRWTQAFLKSLLAEKFIAWSGGSSKAKKRARVQREDDRRRRAAKKAMAEGG